MRKLAVSWLLTSLLQAQPIFDFHSGFWLNLHHFLYDQAKSDKPTAPEWQPALQYYRQHLIPLDLLSDEAATINQQLSQSDPALTLKDPTLAAILNSIAPAYRTQYWPDHDRSNRAWIAAITPLLAKYGANMKKELAAIYATEWPQSPIRTDVSVNANWAGAYTTLDPTHITISSANPGNQGDAALEMVFHEASHAIVGKLRDALSAEAKAHGRLFPKRDFWHAILFYTAGEVTRRHVEAYVPYAVKNGLYDRVWKGVPEILEADWKPYLDGETDMNTAIRRVVAAYSVPK